MIKIAPSLLAADYYDLKTELDRVKTADYLHLDVMDGIFVPNISFGPGLISKIRPHSSLVFDVHLMIKDPIRYIDDYIKAGADIITIHVESCFNVKETLEYIRSKGVKAGLSIKPYTHPDILKLYKDYLDMVLVMSVEPGFGGQKFMERSLLNVRAARDICGTDTDIEIDGGISGENAAVCAEAGVNVFVAGSSVFGASNADEAIAQIRSNAEKAVLK